MVLWFCPMMLRVVKMQHSPVALYTLCGATMNADRWIVPLALCLVCVSSNGEEEYEKSCNPSPYFCETHTLGAPLGSSVLLPCNFANSNVRWVFWDHTFRKNLVNLTIKGHINFLDPRSGRVKVFPNQASNGNYSIRIDELKDEDLGCYRCAQGDACHEVKLIAKAGTLSKETWLLIYICAGVAAFVLLSVCASICCWQNKRKRINTNNPEGAGIVNIEGASAPHEEIGRVSVQGQQQGASAPPAEVDSVPVLQHGYPFGAINTVYENDDPITAHQQGDPIRNYFGLPGVLDMPQPTQSTSGLYPDLKGVARVESQRTRLRFHRELFNRLRQASLRQHYYVNQHELNNQQAMSAQTDTQRRGHRKKKVKHNCEYNNPIYNRGTDHVNQQ
ncbi:uncharacterized protein LOC113125596 isoform X2 [Mastacembelus armatus]|uniref:uncharacterized protein LOC113125596 isoform X2 n=1 Tax=Mastacembelus armatus TaxID=205130 RepID=UPI000E461D96|nr:uncharacterized protein LOC113125596 isoform X2 [Mastacembelus armatus]